MPLPGAANSVPRHILLVDDEPIVRGSIEKCLQFEGHSVVMADGGEQALELVRNAKFDLVITDYEMPGMKGDELAADIKRILPLLPVLLVSAYGELLRTPADPLPAVDAILTKPFRLEELRQAISRAAVKNVSIVGTSPGRDAAQTQL